MNQNNRIKALLKKVGLSLVATVAVTTALTGCSNKLTKPNQSQAYQQESSKVPKASPAPQKGIGGITKAQYQELANSQFKNGTYGYIAVNNNKSTLNPKSWKTNKVIYQNLDKLNRTSSSNTGFLEKRNLANGSLRVRQYINPTGWHYNHGGNQIYNRGHLIAYSVSAGIDKNGQYNPQNESGDQNNPKNLFTQTAYSNQQLQTIYETKIRNALKANKKVIYQATPVFKGSDKMAVGINLQAVSTDKSLDFNVFIYNVQPGYRFNLANGRTKRDLDMRVKQLPPALQSHYSNDRQNQSKSNFNRFSLKHNLYRQYNDKNNHVDSRARRDAKAFEHQELEEAQKFGKKQWQTGKSYLNKTQKWLKSDYDRQKQENNRRNEYGRYK